LYGIYFTKEFIQENKMLPNPNSFFLYILVSKLLVKIQVVADTRSSEAFVALCLLTIAGTSLITQKLGFSDTVRYFSMHRVLFLGWLWDYGKYWIPMRQLYVMPQCSLEHF
jgi:hypothetical protein